MISNAMGSELVEGLCNIFGSDIQQIILYGSVARNEAADDSDIDVAIILDKAIDADNKDLFIHFLSEMDLKYDRVFSVVDIESENIRKWGNVVPFYQNIQKDGVVLWKAV